MVQLDKVLQQMLNCADCVSQNECSYKYDSPKRQGDLIISTTTQQQHGSNTCMCAHEWALFSQDEVKLWLAFKTQTFIISLFTCLHVFFSLTDRFVTMYFIQLYNVQYTQHNIQSKPDK